MNVKTPQKLEFQPLWRFLCFTCGSLAVSTAEKSVNQLSKTYSTYINYITYITYIAYIAYKNSISKNNDTLLSVNCAVFR